MCLAVFSNVECHFMAMFAENDIVSEHVCQPTRKNFFDKDALRPLEKKAINFLVNEYLMANDYKLTAVTFAEENEEQVFDKNVFFQNDFSFRMTSFIFFISDTFQYTLILSLFYGT